MAQTDNFLHTTHRTVSWFNKAFSEDVLQLSAPFQRNPVWTDLQKAYLVDTILLGLPIPELYMQDLVDETGEEHHIVVDGQQRIRAVLDFIRGSYSLEGNDISASWKGLAFDSLGVEEKKSFFSYKFVVRILPALDEEGLRRIFARLNRNVVALNEQELRNATYWGPFIKAIQWMADNDQFWADCGVFSANDHRRMVDHEYISELAIAYLHGPQNKKDKLDHYYQLYEQQFEDRDRMVANFGKVTAEISRVLPNLVQTRWRKKSDFYSLFLALASKAADLPWPMDYRETVSQRILEFGARVDRLLRIEEESWEEDDEQVKTYARSVARAASDRANRVARDEALGSKVFFDA
ncbi:MAG: DUF262 domain-containing protein [Pseudomonadota bacterium]|nr:DUF262 domain-containing protein [Pseudomonadota bacterium]